MLGQLKIRKTYFAYRAAPAFRRILPGEYDRIPYQMIPVNEGPFLSGMFIFHLLFVQLSCLVSLGRAYTGSMCTFFYSLRGALLDRNPDPDGSDRYVRQEQADAVRASIMSGMIDQQV